MSTELQAALPKRHYVDAAAYADERERVLVRSWFCAGRLTGLGLAESGTGSLVPNRVAAVGVFGESVVVAVDAAGGLAAHHNVCRHRGSQLIAHDPTGPPTAARPARALRCPYHSWTYDLCGRLQHAPHTDDLDRSRFGLHPVGVGAWGGFLWLCLEPAASLETLAAAIGPVDRALTRYPLATLQVGYTATYDVRANWKVIAENYNECYHCGPVHPELSRLVPAFAGGGADLDWERGIEHRPGAWTFTLSGTSRRAPFPDLDDDERVRHKGDLVYPNLLLSASADHVAAFRLEPLAVDRTRVVLELLFAAEEVARADFNPSDAAELWELVNGQDWAVCESVQRGMSSRAYREGWYAPMEDTSLDIRRWLLPRLAGPPDA